MTLMSVTRPVSHKVTLSTTRPLTSEAFLSFEGSGGGKEVILARFETSLALYIGPAHSESDSCIAVRGMTPPAKTMDTTMLRQTEVARVSIIGFNPYAASRSFVDRFLYVLIASRLGVSRQVCFRPGIFNPIT